MNRTTGRPMTYRPYMCQQKFPDWSSRLVLDSLPARNHWGTYTDLSVCLDYSVDMLKIFLSLTKYQVGRRQTSQRLQEQFFLIKAVINNKPKLLILIAENYTQYIHFTQLTHMDANTLTCSYQIGATAGRTTPAISSEAEDCTDMTKCTDTTKASKQVFRKCFKWSLVSTGVYIYIHVAPVCR